MQDESRRIRVGHSPDPDDAFMFHALTSGSLETPGRSYEHVLLDIETLNRHALEGRYEISAVSIHSFPRISDRYHLMNCGASMGEGYGPILISKTVLNEDEAKRKKIAIPGLGTSAYLALRLAWGDVRVKVVPFDEILPRVLKGEYEVGLIIHERQLTWAKDGVHLVLDLGVWWNETTGLPLPLGGNVVRKDLGEELCVQLTSDVRESIMHSLEDPDAALEFSKAWGRGIDDDTNREFVGMYVNQRTIDYGADGREGIRLFLSEGQRIGLVRGDMDVETLRFIGSKG
ncbi:MAG: ABC transporter substrate-binding protein [Candidatus Thalassarchaeum betae]|uniref:1,4-dihydroxy-6-naphtoate synthase n=1 Tax=Candidatus Thalassarchaeum betae TaxID=2599289 RepID=A0A2V3HSR1_9ARCH|nr:MAG: ABC transporter substrate-binding protein [Candidatus Thalassoarchaea betae]PXF26862.1 MAG: ABC transporter substrate-binding protein [Euryarchaeota archaeon]HIC51005.1 ABC transporter substrate-binding protein [Candidatus Poseidoniales archaeon]